MGFLLSEKRKASKVRLEDSRETDPSWREKFCSLFVKKEQSKERKWKNPEMICMLCPRRGLHQSCLGHLSHWQQNLSPHLTSSWENPANERLWIKIRATTAYLALLEESVGRNLGNEFIPQRVILMWFSNKKINLGLHTQESFWALASPTASGHIRADNKSCSYIVLVGSPGLFITIAVGKGSWTGERGKSRSSQVPYHVLPSNLRSQLCPSPTCRIDCAPSWVGRDAWAALSSLCTWPDSWWMLRKALVNWTGNKTHPRNTI